MKEIWRPEEAMGVSTKVFLVLYDNSAVLNTEYLSPSTIHTISYSCISGSHSGNKELCKQSMWEMTRNSKSSFISLMFLFSPIMLCYYAFFSVLKIYLLCSKTRIVVRPLCYLYTSLDKRFIVCSWKVRKTVLLECLYEWYHSSYN